MEAEFYLRCFPHVINLVVQAFLDALADSARRFLEDMELEGVEIDSGTRAYLLALASAPVDMCRDSVRAMRSSDLRRDGLQEAIRTGNTQGLFATPGGRVFTIPQLQLLRDSETRWSSTYEMIQRYLELYPVSH